METHCHNFLRKVRMLCQRFLFLSVVFRSGSWRALWRTFTTRPCGMITALPSRSTTVWWSLLSCHASAKEVCDILWHCDYTIRHYNLLPKVDIGLTNPECTPHYFDSPFVFLAFCRQDEIESKLLKIEGLITSLGKHMHSGEWAVSHKTVKVGWMWNEITQVYSAVFVS